MARSCEPAIIEMRQKSMCAGVFGKNSGGGASIIICALRVKKMKIYFIGVARHQLSFSQRCGGKAVNFQLVKLYRDAIDGSEYELDRLKDAIVCRAD